VPRVADVLAVIKGRATGHLDLKETGYEHRLVQLALDVLGPGGFVVTSLEDASVAAIRSRFPDAAEVRVALAMAADPGQRAVACVPAAGVRRGLGRGQPPARARGGRGAVPAAASQGHGLDRQLRA